MPTKRKLPHKKKKEAPVDDFVRNLPYGTKDRLRQLWPGTTSNTVRAFSEKSPDAKMMNKMIESLKKDHQQLTQKQISSRILAIVILHKEIAGNMQPPANNRPARMAVRTVTSDEAIMARSTTPSP